MDSGRGSGGSRERRKGGAAGRRGCDETPAASACLLDFDGSSEGRLEPGFGEDPLDRGHGVRVMAVPPALEERTGQRLGPGFAGQRPKDRLMEQVAPHGCEERLVGWKDVTIATANSQLAEAGEQPPVARSSDVEQTLEVGAIRGLDSRQKIR